MSALRYAHNRANPERRTVGENVVAVYRTPFVTPWRGAQVILVVIDLVGAIPVFVLNDGTLVQFLVLDVGVVVVMVLGDGDAAHQAGGEDRKR